MPIKIEVKPKDKTATGWDTHVMSWNADHTKLVIHKLGWAEEATGIFVGTTGELPPGKYIVRAQLWGPGREVDVTVRGSSRVTQPAGGAWPMNVKVDGATETQDSETWYFEMSQ